MLGILGACHSYAPNPGAPSDRVDARNYDAYYLWPGVHPPDGSKAKTLYLLDGEVRRDYPRFIRLRPGTPHVQGAELWLVVRVNRLDWDAATYAAILADLARWQENGDNVAGLQVDFDASAKGIGGYARFLAGLRAKLPRRDRLSITGLMDWSAHGDPRDLTALRHVVDEVVVQTYQGHDTIPGYDAYFARMAGFPIPFRVALIDGGMWKTPPMLAHQPMFRGYLVFLIKPSVKH